jgi:hypothetical protein
MQWVRVQNDSGTVWTNPGNELYALNVPGNDEALLMSRFSIIKEFLEFLRERKKWWIAPIVIFLLVLGSILIFAKGSALAPFIYSLF